MIIRSNHNVFMETLSPYLELPKDELIYDDGEPLETNRHRIAMNVLIDSIYQAFLPRQDFFAGGNMCVYYSAKQRMNRDFRGPDFFVTLNVDGTLDRKAWIVWQENGRYPDIIVELMSDYTANVDKTDKKTLYEQIFKTREYYIYDPYDATSLQGWRLNGQQTYSEILVDQRGWLFSETLQLYLGTWEGKVLNESAFWLRFYDLQGNLVLLPKEEAEIEHQRANSERQRAETERQQAEMERQRADTERRRAEAEKQRADLLAEKLKELGVDPNEI